MAPKKIRGAVNKFKGALSEVAGFPPVKILLFGSYARGDARRDSDIDLCLISSAFGRRDKERYRRQAVLVAFRTDPRIQVVLAHPDDFKNKLSPLFSHVRREAIAA